MVEPIIDHVVQTNHHRMPKRHLLLRLLPCCAVNTSLALLFIGSTVFASLFFYYSCEGLRQKQLTPARYLSRNQPQRQQYVADSIKTVKELTSLLLSRKSFFSNNAYWDATGVMVDTILYNANFDRLAVLVMTKNSVDRQLKPDKNYHWYYDATCYLGVRKNDSIVLHWIGPSFTNSYDSVELSGIIRNYYFTEFANNDTSGKVTYKYNLNDTRFWEDAIWQQVGAAD
jgi:hypothetical protein